MLQDLNIDDLLIAQMYVPPFICNTTGHVITGDVNIYNNTSLRDMFVKGQKYRDPKSIKCFVQGFVLL